MTVRYRSSAVAVARKTSAALVGGSAPVLAAALLAYFDETWPIAALVMGFGAVSFAAIRFRPGNPLGRYDRSVPAPANHHG
jgi:hypothetical protein